MQRPNLRENAKGPERIIQDAIIKYLEDRLWHVMETHGNMYQSGFPDLYCVHEKHGQRWIEVKNPKSYKFTKAQEKHFPIVNKVCGIWILTAATDSEYQKLWQPPNWYQYLKVMK